MADWRSRTAPISECVSFGTEASHGMNQHEAWGCYVLWPLFTWIRDRYRRPDLCRLPAAHARALDCGGGACAPGSRDSHRSKSDASERSGGMRAFASLRFLAVTGSRPGWLEQAKHKNK